MLLDMRYQNRHVDTHVMGGSNCDIRFVIAWIFTYVNNHNLGHNGTYSPLTYRYIACGGSSCYI